MCPHTCEPAGALAGVPVVPVDAGAGVLAGVGLALVPLLLTVLPRPARLAVAPVPGEESRQATMLATAPDR